MTGKQSFLFLAPDGTRHDLAYNPTSGLYESYDASYIDFNLSSRILRFANGTTLLFNISNFNTYQFALPTVIKDRNGNQINVAYKFLSPTNDLVIDYVTDTLARRIDFVYTSNRLTAIQQNRNGTLFNFAAPVLSLAGRAGLNLNLALSYNSRV